MTTVHDRPIRSQYEDYLLYVWEKGLEKTGRNGVTKSIFGPPQMRFDLSEGFPLVTTKKVFLKAIIVELLWFLNGGRNVQQLHEHSVTIWDEWAREDGDLGPIYGFQWRGWPNWVEEPAHYEGTEWVEARMVNKPIDQIAQVVQQLRSDPDSRRILVSSWNVADLDQMALMPCHAMFQWYVSPELGPNGKRKLSCQLYQRSADSFLGVPFNIASYALLTMMMAQQCDLDVGDFIWVGGDCHIYDKHYEQVTIQLGRAPYPYPTLHIKRRPASIFDYELDDFEVLDYQYHPRILGEVSK